ncbi:hypothetical protein QJQ45_012383 [Haematococcus lacustris]|nr:hypothetical protein QJQ45_012383 [Haematococcus lacustris]
MRRVNCEEDELLCDRWQVVHTPTLKVLHRGEEVLHYKADVFHIDLMRPFILKMHAQLTQATPTAAAGSKEQGQEQAATVSTLEVPEPAPHQHQVPVYEPRNTNSQEL